MKPALLTLLAASGLALILPAAAQAQGWPSIHARQRAFEQRLDDAYYSGAVERDEANRIHAALEDLLRREDAYRYSAPGLTLSELQDLDRRFDMLSERLARDVAERQQALNRYPDRNADPVIREEAPPERASIPAKPREPERYSGVDDGWSSINERREGLTDAIAKARRAGELSRPEADQLMRDFEALVRREGDYRDDGDLSAAERRELDRRYDQIAQRAGEAPDESRWRDIRNIQADLDSRIDEALKDGVIDEAAATRLHEDASDLVGIEDDYRATAPGLTRSEVDDLDSRIAAIEAKIAGPPKRAERAVNDFSR
jgi:hypothetical protein